LLGSAQKVLGGRAKPCHDTGAPAKTRGRRPRHGGAGQDTGAKAFTRLPWPSRFIKTVGPGLLEQIYEDCLCHETALNGLGFQRVAEVSLIYDGVRLPRAYRADIVIGETVIPEIKSIQHILPVHEAPLPAGLRPRRRAETIAPIGCAYAGLAAVPPGRTDPGRRVSNQADTESHGVRTEFHRGKNMALRANSWPLLRFFPHYGCFSCIA
jgi:GxxExxY protein